MRQSIFLVSTVVALAHGQSASRAQGPPPPPETLSTTKSGVLPVLPTGTPFAGVETLEGAIINPGPVNPGFTGLAGTATTQSNLPAATYLADLPDTMFDPYVGTVIRGSVMAVGTDSGVQFTVNLTGLPDQAQYGPFPYHIHALPVPDDGNCTATLGHLDPTNRGEYYMCDTSAPETCQVGVGIKKPVVFTPLTSYSNRSAICLVNMVERSWPRTASRLAMLIPISVPIPAVRRSLVG